MCGICGYFGFNDVGLLKRMCEIMKHRGPDSAGYYSERDIGLGCDRLSIIDLYSGDQPVYNEDKSLCVVFNGEIYNFIELRMQLERMGHSFYTNTDTEVIPHSYEEWGTSCVNRFRGMFAFALWDQKRRRLMLARDRLGKKPLYYGWIGDAFVFASELKALLVMEEIERQINFDALDHFLAYSYVPSPMSIFEGISKLPSAHYMTIEGNSAATVQYWDFPNYIQNMDEQSAIRSVHDLLTESAKIRLRSDVPVGVSLSGGLDSSALVAMISRLSNEPVKTFSIGFREEEYNELKYARIVADYVGADYHEKWLLPDCIRDLPHIIYHFDEPFACAPMIPTYYVSETASREVKVLICGEGGDELFAGYPTLTDPRLYSRYSKLPRFVRKPITNLLARVKVDKAPFRVARFLKEYDYPSHVRRFIYRWAYFLPEEVSGIYSETVKAKHEVGDTSLYVERLFDDPNYEYSVCRAISRFNLADRHCMRLDKMSMAHSVEIRSPLLDHKLFEFILALPFEMKMRNNTTKMVLRKMLAYHNLLPEVIINRKKQGFSPPLTFWVPHEWIDICKQALDSSKAKSYFNQSNVKKLLDDPRKNRSKLFALLVFLIWEGIYVNNKAAPEIPSQDIYRYIG